MGSAGEAQVKDLEMHGKKRSTGEILRKATRSEMHH